MTGASPRNHIVKRMVGFVHYRHACESKTDVLQLVSRIAPLRLWRVSIVLIAGDNQMANKTTCQTQSQVLYLRDSHHASTQSDGL